MTDPNEDFVSFDKALRDLKMQSEELKKLVSEGEIRAFRDGQSMKFRRDDVEALMASAEGEDELVFADSLEDDTGMVTEELSEEDTLLVDDDLEEEEELSASPRAQVRSRREALTAQKAAAGEPAWITAAAILCFVALLWGALLGWEIVSDVSPDGIISGLWKQG